MPQPSLPTEPLKEGARWRHVKPSSEEVAEWFQSVPLDEGMKHEDYIAGVVLIPTSEKVKKRKADGRGTEEVWEETFTPYVRVDTRVTYFRKLAELRELIAVVEPVLVPRLSDTAARNDNMPDGFWWHIAGSGASQVAFLCCTMRVALYGQEDWLNATDEKPARPLREGVGTKQVSGSPLTGNGKLELNALAKAETGAIGRALGVAGILVVGTGIATAEDMTELSAEPPPPPSLPQAGAGEETSEQLNERLVGMDAALRAYPEKRGEFLAWWNERSGEAGWSGLSDAPLDARRGMAIKMQRLLDEAQEQAAPDSSQGEAGEES